MTASGPAGTRREWRAAALAILVGGFVVGDRTTRPGLGRVAVLTAALVAGGGALRVARASRRPPIPPGMPVAPAHDGPTFSVVVAARDEAPVIGRLVRDLAAQSYARPDGSPAFELIVVDDRSADGTGAVAAAAAAEAGIGAITRVVPRDGPGLADGKGAALTAAPPEDCRGDYVVVLDADARLGPGFLAALAGYAAAGAAAITARRRIDAAGRSHLAGAQADEQTLDGELQRGRWASGGCSEFRGNGIVVRRDLLAAVGGWRAEALTEDLDLSSRLAAERGVTVAWAIDAEVREEPVGDWPSLWRQRVRWAEGAIRRLFEHGPAVLLSDRLPLAARADFAAYAGQLLAPTVVLGALAGGLRRRRPGTAAALVGLYAAVGGGLGYDALRWERSPDGRPLRRPERLGRAIRLALFNAVWLLAVPAALWRLATRRGPVRYDKMEHGRAGE